MLIPELVLISTGMRLYHLTSEWGWEGSLLMLCLLPTEKWVEGDGKAAVNSISSWNLLWQHKVIWLWGDTAIALASLASQFSELRVHGLIPHLSAPCLWIRSVSYSELLFFTKSHLTKQGKSSYCKVTLNLSALSHQGVVREQSLALRKCLESWPCVHLCLRQSIFLTLDKCWLLTEKVSFYLRLWAVS